MLRVMGVAKALGVRTTPWGRAVYIVTPCALALTFAFPHSYSRTWAETSDETSTVPSVGTPPSVRGTSGNISG